MEHPKNKFYKVPKRFTGIKTWELPKYHIKCEKTAISQ